MKKVLIVEDDPVWSRVLSRYAKQAGLEVETAWSPQEAMDRIDDQPPALILLDLLLATETGIALMQELRSHSDLKDIPIVVCTSVGSSQLQPLTELGVNVVLDKTTLTPEEVIGTIRSLTNE